jgi:4-carboxymuconolactone decarboxylase
MSVRDPAERRHVGLAQQTALTGASAPVVGAVGGRDSACTLAGIKNFVFGEMWMRPGLDRRARRWLTLVGVAESSATTPIGSHVHAAMSVGDVSAGEMDEFVLQYAVQGGWPKASVMQAAVLEMARRVADGLPFH